MKVRIEFDTDNGTMNPLEAIDYLHEAVDAYRYWEPGEAGSDLIDSNGNAIGKCEVTE